MSASQRRTADSTNVSSTACKSNVERLITLSTSAVAVCCCNDSRSSSSRRVFSMAMTAWLAKLVSNVICASVNGRTFLTIDDDHSNQFIVLEHRHSDKGPDPTEFDGFDDRRVAFGIRLCRCQVGDVDSPLSFNCLAKTGPRRGLKWTASARL